MKLRYFAGLIMAIFLTSTAGAAKIYNNNGNTLSVFGSFVGGHYFSKNINRQGDHSFVRCGLLGRTYINDQVVGFGMWEHEISLKNVEGSGIRIINGDRALLGYIGIDFGNFGSIDYGRNYGVLYDVGSWTDVVPAFGRDLYLVDNFLSNRSSNIVTYRNKDLFGCVDGLNFAVQYQGKNDVNVQEGRTIKTANGEGYGVSASYTLKNGIAASAAYTNSKRLLDQKNLDDVTSSDNDNAEAYSFGIKYDGHGVYAAATYGETYYMTPFGDFDDHLSPDNIYGFINKTNNVEFVAQYQFDFGLRPSISYLQSKSDDFGGIDSTSSSSGGNYLKRFVTVGTGYLFNKNFSTTLNYRINLLNQSDLIKSIKVGADDIITLGVAYTF